jgi:CDP-diacylglycerol--glycerol-3-phosphate 3-phosphatidyltransferase
MISDYFDGFLARRWNQTSNTGKILDPLADKICLATGAVALTIYGDLPLSLLLMILARDVVIAFFGITIIKKIKQVPVSNIIGKAAVFIISLSMLVYIVQYKELYDIAYFGSVTMIIVSSISYLIVGIKFLSNKS